VVLWHLRYRLSLRDLAEMFLILIRGIMFSHEAVRDWKATGQMIPGGTGADRTPHPAPAEVRYLITDRYPFLEVAIKYSEMNAVFLLTSERRDRRYI
jgi:hypothetical protein